MWDNGLAPGQAFDASSPSPLLVQYIKEGKVPEGRALVPGCGRGYDVTALSSPNRVVLGLDIAEGAVVAARERLASLEGEECFKQNALFSTTSFFSLHTQPVTLPLPSASLPLPLDVSAEDSSDSQFDFIYDYTFLCALDPTVRGEWAAQMGRLLRPGGELLTLVFPIRPSDGQGPPFAVSLDLMKELLLQGPAEGMFECVELELLPPALCHLGRDGLSEKFGGAKSGVGRWRRL